MVDAALARDGRIPAPRRGRGVVRATARRWACLAWASMAIGGCAERQETPNPPRTFADVQVGDVRSSVDGVVVEYWICDLSSGSLGRALERVRRYEVTGRRAGAWRSNGLRVFLGPTEEVIAAVTGITMAPQTRRETLPMLPRWMPIATGRRWDSGVDVWLDQQDWGDGDEAGSIAVSMGRLSLGPGSMRLLARTWIASGTTEFIPDGIGPGVPTMMVLEMAPQHHGGSTARSLDLAAATRSSSARGDGQFFDRLRLELACEPGQTALIVPAHPREEWLYENQGPLGRGSPDPSRPMSPDELSEGDLEILDEGVQPVPTGPAGPQLPDLLTIGEAMLTDARVGRGASRRVILSVTPRLTERFERSERASPRLPRPETTVR
ncbi:MAG: hypothetical protein JNK70_02060 [Phycisphaerae bacterium]|nr:hypothetical protein [Phycisphaerae bacterium]